jgi:uncharacterized caspase-like protein
MRQILLMLMAVLGICCLGGEVRADTRVALVIGNSAYANAPALAKPRRDAEAIAQLFKQIGFDQVQLVLDADNAAFRKAIRQFDEISAAADIAVVFYAGYGLEVRGVNYLIPVDATLASELDAPDEAVALERLVSAIGARKFRLVLLDAGRDNPYAGRMRRVARADAGPALSGLGRVEPTQADMLIAYAAKAGSTSVESDGEHSPFVAALLKNIAVPGLDVRLAFGRVRDEVMKSTAGRQEPFVYGSMDAGVLSLVPASNQPASDDSGDVRADYELVEKIGTARALKVFLDSHPTGHYADLVREDLKRFETGMGAPNWGDDVNIKRLQEQAK